MWERPGARSGRPQLLLVVEREQAWHRPPAAGSRLLRFVQSGNAISAPRRRPLALEPLGWPEQRLRACIDACEQHHAPSSRWWMPNEVQLVRRSDFVEVLPELVRFGIPRSWPKRELWHVSREQGEWWPAGAVADAHPRRDPDHQRAGGHRQAGHGGACQGAGRGRSHHWIAATSPPRTETARRSTRAAS